MSGSITATPPGTGMIPAAVPFLAPDLSLTPLSFRFLFELFKNSGNYAQRLAALEAKMGVTDGSNAAAGQIGEYLYFSNSFGGFVTDTPVDMADLVLSPGDWDVYGSAIIAPSTANMVLAEAWLSTVSHTPQNEGIWYLTGFASGIGTLGTVAGVVGPVRYSVAAPATRVVYLSCQASFPSGTTVSSTVWITARRVR